jgi:hypothetical protein
MQRTPIEGLGIDDYARPGGILGVEARGRVSDDEFAIDPEAIASARSGGRLTALKPALVEPLHGKEDWLFLCVQTQFDTLRRRCPQPETHAVRC